MVSIFRGQYFFLSNEYLANIKYLKFIYKSAEHLYQSVSCEKRSDRDRVRSAETGKSAKVIGKYVKKRAHWDVDKVKAMERTVRLKFHKKKLRKLLRATKGMELINQNYMHDMFWGVCGCTLHQRKGLNMLGKILMKIRDDIP